MRRRKRRKPLARAATDAEGLREPGRFRARRKTETILRMLRGEPLDSLARELGLTAATLAHWREQFLAGGQTALKSRPADDRDEEISAMQFSAVIRAPILITEQEVEVVPNVRTKCRAIPTVVLGAWGLR